MMAMRDTKLDELRLFEKISRMARPLPAEGMNLLARFSDEVYEILLRLRSRVLDLVPQAHEIVVDAGYTISLHYGPDDHPSKAVAYIAGFSKHVNLGFLNGASLPDPEAILTGTGRRMRHVKFFSVEATSAVWLPQYVLAAMTHAGLSDDMGDGQTSIHAR
jgi:hypothetical protein